LINITRIEPLGFFPVDEDSIGGVERNRRYIFLELEFLVCSIGAVSLI
jgi:hypothetical protein